MEYAAAKRKAAQALGRRGGRADELPSNEQLEDAVREHIALFHADTQPDELAALRRLALQWIGRLDGFRPHVSGAVWRGTATRRSAVHIDLYCDDPKSAEINLLDRRIDFDVATLDPWLARFAALVRGEFCPTHHAILQVFLLIGRHLRIFAGDLAPFFLAHIGQCRPIGL